MRAPGAGPAGVPPSCYRPSEGALRRRPGSLGRCPGDAGAGPHPQLGGEAWGATERATDALVLARTGDEPELPAKKRLVKADEGKREAFVADYANLWDEARRTGDKVFFADEAHFRADAELRGKWVLRGEPAPRFHGGRLWWTRAARGVAIRPATTLRWLWTNLRCHGVTAGRTDQLVASARAGYGHKSAMD